MEVVVVFICGQDIKFPFKINALMFIQWKLEVKQHKRFADNGKGCRDAM